jgi:O-antigen ligase
LRIVSVKEWLAFARDKNFSYTVMLLIMAIMPINNRYLPPLMILLLLCWINDNSLNFDVLFRLTGKSKILFLLFLLFFVWQSAGLLYSDNQKIGSQNLGSRLSMLLFPLILFSTTDRIRSGLNVLLRVFSLSASLYLVSCFIYAFFRSLSVINGHIDFNPHPVGAEWENYFYNQLLTFSIHPSYMAMYAIISLLISLESAKDKMLSSSARIWFIVCGIFLFISLYFISSRAALIAMIVIVPLYVIYNLIILRKSKITWIVFIAVMVLTVPFILKNERYKSLIETLKDEKYSELHKSDDRIIIWKSAIKIIKSNVLFGVGVGDSRDELVKQYDQLGADKQRTNKMNAHNQLLQFFLESGLVGVLIFLAIISFMTYIAISEKNFLYGLFIIMFLVFFTFESVLYRFAGISFFSLFSFLLLYFNVDENTRL